MAELMHQRGMNENAAARIVFEVEDVPVVVDASCASEET